MVSSAHSSPPVMRIAGLSRQVGEAVLLFHAQMAKNLGLSATEYICLNLVVRAGNSLTAGQMANLAGLSTGAVTGIIDRLERAMYVRRVRHPRDRRKVLVEASEATAAQVQHAAETVMTVPGHALASYSTVELTVIERYLDEWLGVLALDDSRTVRS
jgi:DNA-binding MarR family transcriptional regulator